MNTRVLLAALAGGIVAFLSGWIFYVALLGGFFEANAGSATGVMKDPPELWAIFIGSLAWALLYAMIFTKWAGISTLKAGAIAGAWISLLISISFDFTSFGSTNMMNFTATIVDPIVGAAMGALIGGTVGWVLGYNTQRSGS